MKWVVDVKGKQHVVEAEYGKFQISSVGVVSVDGKPVKTIHSSIWGLPKEVSFEIKGQSALLVREGVINQNFRLFFGGKYIERI